MKILSALLFLFLPFSQQKELSSTTVLQKMYDRYHNKWHSSLSFNQTTERYKNDSLVKSDTWYERIAYPDMLRIDIGNPNSSNGIIFRKDSIYVFNNNKITRSIKNENELIFFLGGLYFVPFDDVLAHFKALNYDLSKFHSSTWKGHPVYVIGADKDDEKVNQLWVDQDKLIPVRFIKYDDKSKEEGLFEQHIPLKNAWSETKCTFYVNDKLLQVEKYHNVVPGGSIDKSIFDPGMIGK
jgi:outer membrane lipoprotein-sorting protein